MVAALVLSPLLLAACTDQSVVAPASPTTELAPSRTGMRQLARQVRELAQARGITPMGPRPRVRGELAELGQMLLFDRLLSGNRDISCMSCHLPAFATGDGRSLSIGQGGRGLGPGRVHPGGAFIPRNAPPLFNLHLARRLFWDGRVSVDAAGNFETPAGAALTPAMTAVFEFGAVSAIGLFPVLSREEMRGIVGDNELAGIADDDRPAVWAALMRRLGAIPRYRQLFEAAYPGTRFDDMTFAHASNAMAAFLLKAFDFDNAPWDRFLAGNDQALTAEQLEGAMRFMNAPCAQCHGGPGFSDDDFHNVALAQFGPGVGNGPSGRDDFGRMNVTGRAEHVYRFRSPMLRNVELTGPYGHAGQIADLAAFVDHYSHSADKLRAYGPATIPDALLRALLLVENREAIIATRDPLIVPVAFDADFTRQVTAFMTALTDRRARDLSQTTPRRVPSGLPVDR
jgi:cytochrome c peroxidase